MSKSKLCTFLLIFLSFSAIFCFYNFDSASAQGVTWTYNADTNTATASGSGSTNFAALVAADTAGGWGKFTADASGIQIICAGKIVIGDGTNACVFTDTLKEVMLANAVVTGYSQPWITISNNSTLTLGVVDDATDQTTSRGCDFKVNESTYSGVVIINGGPSATVNCYSCTFASLTSAKTHVVTIKNNGRMWNCILSYNIYLANCVSDVYNLQIQTTTYYGLNLCTGTFEKLSITQQSNGAIRIWGNAACDITDAYIRNVNGRLVNVEGTRTLDTYWVNFNTDTWNFNFMGTCKGVFYRQYTFNINVLNGNITDFVQNANVTLYKDGSKIYSALTNSSGMIPTQTLTYGYYQQSTGNTIQNATSPYYLVVTHPDWQTYVSRFYITEPLRLTVSMQESTYTGYTEVEKSDYTTIILFVISLILCIIGLALTVPLLPLISLTISVINIIFLSEPSIFNILLIVLNVTFTLIALVRAKTKNN